MLLSIGDFGRRFTSARLAVGSGPPRSAIRAMAASAIGMIGLGRNSPIACAWEMIVGPRTSSLTLDHLCSVRSCVNPSHLVEVPRGVNAMRGGGPAALNTQKTHCPHGHPLSGANLYVTPAGARNCRMCRRMQLQAFRARRG